MPSVFRPRRRRLQIAQDLEKNLKNIYGRDGLVNLTKIEQKHHSRLTAFLLRLVIFLFLVAAAAYAGFFWWQNQGDFSARPLVTRIEGPTEVVAGATSCFKIHYENSDQVPIAALSVSVNFPETFVLTEAKPLATENNNLWLLSPLGSGSDGSIDFCGRFRSTVPGSEKIQAVFTYRPANFSSDFQDIAGLIVSLEESVLTVAVSGPTETVVGDQTLYEFKIKNTSSEIAENLRLRPKLPESFTITSSTPAFTETETTFWNLPTLAAGEEQIFTLTGAFSSSAAGLMSITAEAGFLDADQNFIKQTETKADNKVIGGELAFNLIINGSSKDQTADLGGRLRLSLTYANRGTEIMEDISFSATLTTADGRTLPIDFTASDLAEAVQSDKIFTWDKNNLPALAQLEPNATGTIDPVLTTVGTIEAAASDVFTILIKATVGKIGGIITEKTISSTPITIKINSDAKILTEARYFDRDDVPLGTGPLPPKVGETTTYRIFWTINNSLHDLKKGSVVMTLPSDVGWVNNVEAGIGALTFNETTRQVLWSFETLTKETLSVSAWFDVAIVPTASDVGSFFNLTNPAAFEATDATTDDLVHGSTDALTTAVPYDFLANGKGVVE